MKKTEEELWTDSEIDSEKDYVLEAIEEAEWRVKEALEETSDLELVLKLGKKCAYFSHEIEKLLDEATNEVIN